jgi:hypothetical protein
MKRLSLLTACLVVLQFAGHSQDFSMKYGKVSNYELSMKSYDKDTTAEAVIIYDDGNTYYEYTNNDFKINLEIKQKIKILKQEGVDRATISLPYYFRTNGDRESITGLEAYSYNLEDGKVIKSKLEKKYIFDEELSSRYRQLKFSIPNVKVGSVIEFKYKRITQQVYELPDWYIQSSIPVIHSSYEVMIPEYFIFNNETKGYETIKVIETPQNQQFNVGMSADGSNVVTCQSRDIKYIAENVPALKNEPYVWCKNDFTSGVRFELSGTKFPNTFYKPYTQTWDNLEETIKKETDFGSNLKMSNPFEDEIKALIDTVKNEKTKIELIYSFMKNRIKWNDIYSFYGNRSREAVKNKIGDNGQINMILISALKDAHIKAYPILISRRSQGRIPYTYPSFDKLTTFIVAATTQDGKTYYMDGSATYGGLNMLPTDLIVDRGRVMEGTIADKWIDLTKIVKNQSIYLVKSTIDKNGILTGTLNTGHINQMAYKYKAQFYGAKDSLDFIEKIETNSHIKLNEFVITGKEPMSNTVKETASFTRELNPQGDYIYINPMVFMHLEKNPFTQSERKLPIEFDYPYGFQVSSIIEIPENYKVEELPKSIKIALPDNVGRCIYQVSQEENKIQLNYRFDLNQTIFPSEFYSSIRDFYAQVASKNAELVVLKKAN